MNTYADETGIARILHRRAVAASRGRALVRVAAGLCLVVAVSACQTVPEPPDVPDPPTEWPGPAPEEEPEEAPPPINQALEEMQAGRGAAATELLNEILAEHPGHRLAARLLEQIETPPEELLGEQYREVEVAAGESLSLIAERHLGDALLFFALARYNGIERPRDLEVGQMLRVPADSAMVEPEPEPVVQPPVARARELLAAGMDSAALDVLLDASRSEAGDRLVETAALGVADRELEGSDVAAAVTVLERADEYLGPLEPAHPVQRKLQEARMHMALALGDSARERGDLDAAWQYYSQARGMVPEFDLEISASAALAGHLREAFHEQALKAWRARDVDRAIELWERVREIDPGFAPAQVYLERARELRERLTDM